MLRLVTILGIALILAIAPSSGQAQTIPIAGAIDTSVTFDPNDARLTADQKQQIAQAYELALSQVNAGLQYLELSRDRILAGNDVIYNNAFGRFYDTNPATNPLFGTYDQGRNALIIGDDIGTANTIAAGATQITFPNGVVFRDNLEVGDRIVVDGRIRIVAGITTAQPANTVPPNGQIPKFIIDRDDDNGNGQGNNNQNPTAFPEIRSIELFRPIGQVAPENFDVFKIEGETLIPDRRHYNTVVDILEEIREIMMSDTRIVADLSLAEAQTIYNAVFAADFEREQVAGRSRMNGFPLDLRTRFAGLSNSESQTHLDQIATDPDNPLFWTEDFVDLATDNAFYDNFLTAIAQNSGANPQLLLGQAFLDQMQNNVGGLLNGDPSQVSLATQDMYQMIIAAFAELSSDGAFGIMDLYELRGAPNGIPLDPFPQNRDAEAIADFLDILTDPRAGTGIGDGTGLPPEGKQRRINGDDDFDLFIPFIPFN